MVRSKIATKIISQTTSKQKDKVKRYAAELVTEEDKFIDAYYTRLMRPYKKLHYGLQWLNRHAEAQEKAEKAWKRKQNKQSKKN